MAVDWEMVGALAGIVGAVSAVAANYQVRRYHRKAQQALSRPESLQAPPATEARASRWAQPSAKTTKAGSTATAPPQDKKLTDAESSAVWKGRASIWRVVSAFAVLLTIIGLIVTVLTMWVSAGNDVRSFGYQSGDEPVTIRCKPDYKTRCLSDVAGFQWRLDETTRSIHTTLGLGDGSQKEVTRFLGFIAVGTDCSGAIMSWTLHINGTVVTSGLINGRGEDRVDIPAPQHVQEVMIEATRTDNDPCESQLSLDYPSLTTDGPFPWS